MPDKLFKQKCRVERSPGCFGVKLDREEGFGGMNDPFVRQIVCIEEERFPERWQRFGINGITMILRSNVTPSGAQIDARLIHSTIAVLEFVRVSTRRQGQQLIAQTNAKDGFGRFEIQCVLDGSNGGGTHGRITRTVGQEEAIPIVERIRGQVVIEWDDCELDLVRVDQITNNVVLHATIVGQYTRRLSLAVHDNLLRGDFRDQIALVGILKRRGREGAVYLVRILSKHFDLSVSIRVPFPKISTAPHVLTCRTYHLQTSKDRSMFAQCFGQFASIDPVHGGDVMFGQPCRQTSGGRPM